MRKKFIAGNWKMNTDAAEAVALVEALLEQVEQNDSADAVDIAVCPPFVYLDRVLQTLSNGPIAIGAQNVYFESNGAFTGEISVTMLNDLGCRYVILGHSERRHVIGETDALINKKLHAALGGGLEPIFCIGELLEQREAGQTEAVCERQLREGLAGVTAEQMKKITVAYEPVWAIGTGKTATSEQAQEVHAFVRGLLGKLFDAETAEIVRIQYGGSVKASNAAELMSNPDVDGVLVGGASLKADEFASIIESAKVTMQNAN